MDLSIKNAMVHTNSNIIEIWYGIIKQISRQTLLSLKQRKKNFILTSSSVLTTKVITKQIILTVPSGNIGLIRISIVKSCRSSKKSEPIQFS